MSQQLGSPEQTAEFKVKESVMSWKINKIEAKGEEAAHFQVVIQWLFSRLCNTTL